MVGTKQTLDIPVMRVSTDNGATFGTMLMLATNGTIGEAEGTEEEGWGLSLSLFILSIGIRKNNFIC